MPSACTTLDHAMRLEGRTAIITGAGSGIGRAMAECFAADGANVVAADIDADRLKQLEGAVTVQADVSTQAGVDEMADAALNAFGRIDVLCNNAGIVDGFMPAAEVTDEVWNRVLAVNLNGPLLASRRVLPVMVEQGRGSIVNTASVAGLRGAAGGVAYTVSKHGVIGLTRSIASTYSDFGIRCNAICPGGVATNITAGQELNARVVQILWESRAIERNLRQPEEIARIAVFLASDDASYINGAAIVADGGAIAR